MPGMLARHSFLHYSDGNEVIEPINAHVLASTALGKIKWVTIGIKQVNIFLNAKSTRLRCAKCFCRILGERSHWQFIELHTKKILFSILNN